MAISHDDFQVYELLDTGERNPLAVQLDKINEILNVENVLLLVRLDLRRLFIWKGPKSPVRKRFISSREGSKLQEEMAKFGMHLKIISVDAGEEPAEFLQAFNIDSMQIGEHDRMEDLRYIRNDERRMMEEAEKNAKLKSRTESADYKSPALEELKKKGGGDVVKAAVTSPGPEVASVRTSVSEAPPARAPMAVIKPLSESQEKTILDKILLEAVPQGLKRLNIVIGTSLYGPQTVVKKVFGQSIESEEFGKIGEIPAGKIDIPSGTIRAYVANNMVEGLEVLVPGEVKEAPKPASQPPVTVKPLPTAPSPEAAAKKRNLPQIPRGE